MEEYKEKIQEQQTDKNEVLVYLYASDKNFQDSYIRSAKKKGYDVLVMNSMIDSHFIGTLEQKMEKTTWKRVDSETVDKLVMKEESEVSILSEEQEKLIEELFKGILGEGQQVQVQALGQEEMPVVVVRNEFMRRMKEQAMLGGMPSDFMAPVNFVVNSSNELAGEVLAQTGEAQTQLAQKLVDLAKLSQGLLTGSDLTDYIERSLATAKG